MSEIDCKIVLEEYLLLHEAYENQEFKRLLLELEYGGASACEEGKALLNQAKAITSQPLQVSKWNKDTQAFTKGLPELLAGIIASALCAAPPACDCCCLRCYRWRRRRGDDVPK